MIFISFIITYTQPSINLSPVAVIWVKQKENDIDASKSA